MIGVDGVDITFPVPSRTREGTLLLTVAYTQWTVSNTIVT
jgi:hypothetical protein